MKSVLKCVACVIFLLCAAESFAQSPNSAEHHRQWNPQHPGYDGNRYSPPPSPPQEVWENKYVVITSDFNTGASGFAESTRSLRAARREAMRECGTRQCRISAEATNGCVVIVHGDSSFSTFGAGATYEDAAAKAESNCRANGGRVCSIGFQHCALPVRIR